MKRHYCFSKDLATGLQAISGSANTECSDWSSAEAASRLYYQGLQSDFAMIAADGVSSYTEDCNVAAFAVHSEC